MSKEMTVIALGVWIVAVPYLGVPGSWRTIILVVSGIVIGLVGFFLRAEALARHGKRSEHHPFIENVPAADRQVRFDTESPHHDRKEGINSLN